MLNKLGYKSDLSNKGKIKTYIKTKAAAKSELLFNKPASGADA
jgi:hypothetical protein